MHAAVAVCGQVQVLVHGQTLATRDRGPDGGGASDEGTNLVLDLLANGLDFRAGVSNAFDRRVVYMEPATFGDVPLAYQDRTTWVGVTWRLRSSSPIAGKCRPCVRHQARIDTGAPKLTQA